ncbi:hypothetical protein HJ526_17285 [Donghicola sp. C2-DW-16]|uniref:Nucleotide-diphospho-sugar transferase n=1 Tax=Donghicola mangrovi TaxID=2729614 RepID=A0ABX2PL02_9RHOB|nr:hypothetical protein [Donghicola mangrovi]NVO29179.1 hypothetical protein [Donghicola mangrovi]
MPQALRHYGLQARQRIFCPHLQASLNSLRLEEATAAFATAELVREFIWFCFGQRNWRQLCDLREKTAGPFLEAVGPEVWDLFFIAGLRQQERGLMQPENAPLLRQELERHLSRFTSIWPQEVARAALYSALLAHMRGDVAEARSAIGTHVGQVPLCGPLRAMATILPPATKQEVDLGQIDVVQHSVARNVLLLSCDASYFATYYAPLAQSFLRSAEGGDWGIHLHCIGFDPRQSHRLEGLGQSVGLSLDHTPIRPSPVNWKGAYCASARYLYAPLYLSLYERLLVSDIDGLFPAPLQTSEVMDTSLDLVFSSKTLCHPSRQMYALPWNMIAAGCTLFNATLLARQFANRVAGYLAAIFQSPEERPSTWFADQIALFYCLDEMGADLRFTQFRTVPFQQAGNWEQFKGVSEKLEFVKAPA